MNGERKYQLHDGKLGAAITVQVVNGSRQNEIAEILEDGTLKIKLAVKGYGSQVNQVLIDFLAGILAIPSDSIEIIAGQNSRDKLVTVLGLDAHTVQNRILNSL